MPRDRPTPVDPFDGLQICETAEACAPKPVWLKGMIA